MGGETSMGVVAPSTTTASLGHGAVLVESASRQAKQRCGARDAADTCSKYTYC